MSPIIPTSAIIEIMWNIFSDDTLAFPKLNNMEKNDIEGAGGTHLSRSLTVFSTWMLSELKPGLDGKKFSLGSRSHVGDYCNYLCYV